MQSSYNDIKNISPFTLPFAQSEQTGLPLCLGNTFYMQEKEIIVPLKDSNGMYEVSSLGIIYSVEIIVEKIVGKRKDGTPVVAKIKRKRRVLKPALHRSGYLRISLYLDGINRCPKSHHRVILSAFILPQTDKHQVNHINGIKTDNRLCNLEWVTQSENQKHAFRTGLKKLTEAQKIMLAKYSRERKGDLNNKSVTLLNLETGIYYDTIGEAAFAHNILQSSLSQWTRGKYKNKTKLIALPKILKPKVKRVIKRNTIKQV